MAVDGLPNPKGDELSWLKGGSRGASAVLASKIVLGVTGLVVALLAIVFISHRVSGGEAHYQELHYQLASVQEPWSDEFASQVDGYHTWIENHGTSIEMEVFEDIASFLIGSTLSTSSSPSESFFSAIFVSAHTGAARVLFLILASLRIWVVTLLVALYFGASHYRVYRGDDLLGQTGNGRLFYSGARGGLDNLTPSGAPDVLVRGLACPQYSSKPETHASNVWRALRDWGATNTTNEALSAIIHKNGATASFIPRLEDEALYDRMFSGSSLLEHVPHIINAALELHARYAGGDTQGSISDAKDPSSLSKCSSEEYARAVQYALHQVLSPEERGLIGALTPHEVATFVLALESGKVLAHSLEGGKWFRRSNFPQLSARAVLHSVLDYPVEYDFDSRHRIRQALVYASRTSSFAPVRMPIGMTRDTWALRQWGEVLLAAPHELADVLPEVELVGLVRSAHTRWTDEVLPKATSFVPDLTTTSYATYSDLFFLPLQAIVNLLRRTVEPTELSRIAELSRTVGTKQKERIERAQNSEEGGSATLIYDRVFAPISDDEIATLAKTHGLSEGDLRDWSALRNILASFGWLARRVGDYTVAESSVIFSVFKAPPGYPHANSLGFFGRQGLVPLRSAKFADVWGREWDRRFQSFQKATMAETQEDFEKALKGIKEETVDEVAPQGSPVLG